MEANDSLRNRRQIPRNAPAVFERRAKGLGALAASFLLFTSDFATAQGLDNWLGSTGDWDTGSNWSAGTIPSSTESAVVGGNGTTVRSITFSAPNNSVGGIVFSPATTGQPFTITLSSLDTLTVDGASGLGFSNYSIFNESGAIDYVDNSGVINLNGGALNAGLGDEGGPLLITNDTGGRINFNNSSSAGSNIQIVTNSGAVTTFLGTSSGGQAEFVTNAGGTMDISQLTSSGMTAGSIAGAGTYMLGSKALTVGGNTESTTVSGTILGPNGGSLIKVGFDTLTLSGANSYTGGTTIDTGMLRVFADNNLGANTGGLTFDSGTLETSATFTTGRPITVDSGGGTFETDNGTTLTVTSNIAGSGDLTKSGGGVLVLSGNDSGYTGSITISAGTLQAGSANAFNNANGLTVNAALDLHGFNNTIATLAGNNSGIVTNNGSSAATLSVVRSVQFAGNISDGISKLSFSLESGSSELSGNNTYSGITDLFDGATLQAESVTALSPNSPFVLSLGSTLDLGGYNNAIASLSGSGTVTTSGGNAILTVLNAAAGTKTTFSGNLLDGSGSSAFGLTVSGAGSLTLSGKSAYSGPTLVQGTLRAGSSTAFSPSSAFVVNGVLDLNGNNNSVGSLTGGGTVTNNAPVTAILTVGQTDSSTIFSGDLTDGTSSLALIKTGAGTLTLAGALNTYTGNTIVNGGNLNVAGKISASNVTVDSGGTLTGTGIIGGGVTITPGGSLAPGIPSSSSVGTLTVGSLTMNSGSILDYQLGAPNVIGGGINDLIQVNGNLTLAGTLNITNVGGFGEGVYQLINYSGSLTNNGLAFGALPPGITTSDLLLATSQAGKIDLLVSATGFTDQFWDGTTTVGNGTIEGGSGVWNNTTTNWTNADAKTNAPWNKGFAIFGGAAGTVTLGDNINLIGLQFMTDGYVIYAPGSQTLIASPGSVIRVDSGVTATIEAPIVDTKGIPGDITKTDAGTLVLTGTNTYSGGTTISGGTLQLGNGGTSGSIVGNVVDNGIFAIDRSDAFTLGGNISGTGVFEQLGMGQTTLTGTNTYFGATTVSSGILRAGSVDVFSPNSQVFVNSGATLDLNGFSNTIGSLTGNGSIINSAKLTLVALTLGSDNTDDVFSGVIGQTGGGTLSVIKAGLGTEVLTGANLYTGGTTISGGTLQLGDGGTTGSIIGKVTDNAVFAIDRSNNYTFNGAISGTGSVEQVGKGTTIFTGNDTYTGGTTISAGRLQIGDGGTTGSIVGKVTDDRILAFDRSDAYTFSGKIKGRGSVEQLGTGTLTLSGANSYSGGTELDSGTLMVDNPSALGTGDVTVNGGILTADPQPINVQGNYFQGPNGTLQLTVTGANTGQYDFLNVTGNAALGGTLKLINQGLTPQAGETLTLVKSGGGITSKFATFIDPYTTGPGLNTIDLVYSLHTVVLEFLDIIPPSSPSSPPPPSRITTINFVSFGQTPNEVAAGELLDAVELNPRFGNLLNFFLSQPFGDLPSELALISPEAFSSFYEINFSGANIQRLNLENRLDEIRLTGGTFDTEPSGGMVGLQKGEPDGKTGKNPVEPVLQPVVKPLFDLWASGYGDFVHVDSDYNARGYRFTTSGFDLGFDYRFLDHFAVGVMGNYAYTWTDLRPGTITVNSGRGGLYASYFNGDFYVDAGVYGGYNTYDTNRHALFGNAIGNTDGSEWSGFISTGYDFHTRKNLTIGPVASLQYTNVNVSGFTEQGSLVPMSIHSASEESLRTDLGFRATYQWQVGHVVIEPYVKAEWEHEFKYSALPVTASLAQFPGPDETFYGPAEGQDSAVVSAGVSVQWTSSVSSFVGYDGQLGRGRYNSNAVNGGVRVSW